MIEVKGRGKTFQYKDKDDLVDNIEKDFKGNDPIANISLMQLSSLTEDGKEHPEINSMKTVGDVWDFYWLS